MKKFVQVFKIPLIIFAILLVIGVACKLITNSRQETEFVRGNTEALTEERVFDVADKLTAEEEKVLTNGETYGKVIYLADGVSPDSFYEITEAEYAEIEEKERQANMPDGI